MKALQDFSELWVVDFEFSAPEGERPHVVCLAAREIRSGRLIRLWRDQLTSMRAPPYSIGADSLFIAYFASAEIGCHLSLGWELPTYILDPFVEFGLRTNGLQRPGGRSLLGALMFYGLNAMDAEEKRRGRELAMRESGAWSSSERRELLDYC